MRKGSYTNAKRPHLVLLDLNLPRKDGREVLAEIKNDSELKLIPVIVMSSSEAEQDVHYAYNHRANCYIKKPADYNDYLSIVQQIEDFWFRAASLPAVN